MKPQLKVNRKSHIIRYTGTQYKALSGKNQDRISNDSDIFGISMSQIQKNVRRLSMIDRMEKKNKEKEKQKHTQKLGSRKSTRNFSTADTNKSTKIVELNETDTFKKLRKIYLREQGEISKLMNVPPNQDASKSQTIVKNVSHAEQSIKQGLLGERKYYEKMTKDELIDKLIALEYLTKKLYKQNKLLQQKVQKPQQ